MAVRVRLHDGNHARRIGRPLLTEVIGDRAEVRFDRAQIDARDGWTNHGIAGWQDGRMAGWLNPAINFAVLPSCLPAISRACGEVLEARELADECELDDAGRTVALLADDELRHALAVRLRLALVGV